MTTMIILLKKRLIV